MGRAKYGRFSARMYFWRQRRFLGAVLLTAPWVMPICVSLALDTYE
ncbi:MAG: hypothetical protein ACJASV_002670 [Pseudorhodobacter sp.]|jgi:hypothetical protein